jgi:hypothetical protein
MEHSAGLANHRPDRNSTAARKRQAAVKLPRSLEIGGAMTYAENAPNA